MHPATARALVALVSELTPNPIIFDPFCGSGTTLVEAQNAGLASIGVDANPLAVRISRAKTWTVPRREREQLRSRGGRIASRSLAESKAARRSGYEAPVWRERKSGAELLGASFLKHTRRELEFLYGAILKESSPTADILQIPLSAILHKVSLRASDSERTLVHRRIARGAPSRLFAERVDALIDGLGELARAGGRAPPPQVTIGDARRLPNLTAGAVVTSPPYPGTYDYAAHHELRLAFLELDDSLIDSREIGARRSGGGRAALARWRADTKTWLEQAAKVVGSGRFVAAVVGDSVAGHGAILADEELKRLAPSSLAWMASASQTRAKRGGREREAFGKRPKQEHVLLFRGV